MTRPSEPPPFERVELDQIAATGGVVWSVSPEGFHANFVALAAGEGIAAHRNDAVDVLVLGISGTGAVTIDGTDADLAASVAIVVPKGATRAVHAGASGVSYFTIHAHRPPLNIIDRSHS